jgi:hypothetical protein
VELTFVAAVKNAWSSTSVPHYVFMACIVSIGTTLSIVIFDEECKL